MHYPSNSFRLPLSDRGWQKPPIPFWPASCATITLADNEGFFMFLVGTIGRKSVKP